ncbi:hypothetical protein MMC22_006083 [Lobaria immixta]|nr:hypothetical protein [Lobaria immixta]
MTSPPSPPPELLDLQVHKPRDRSDTARLLPRSFDPASVVLPAESSTDLRLEACATERLQQNLAYAQKCLMRQDLSPRSEVFMAFFKDQLKEAMHAETSKEKLASAASVRVFEMMIQKNSFLRAEKFTKRMNFSSTYSSCESISTFQGMVITFKWSEIADKLASEKLEFKKLEKGGAAAIDTMNIDTTIVVRAACRDLGISKSLAIWSIVEYGQRNVQMHRDLEALISKGDFRRLAEVLHDDIDDIDCVFSEFRSNTDKRALKDIISSEIDKWFDRSEDLEDHNLWMPRPELLGAYKKLKTVELSRAEKKAVNIAEHDRRSEEKSARHEAASLGSSDP